MTSLVDEGRAAGVCISFCKTFDTVFCSILMDKLMKHNQNKRAVRWTENWQNHRAGKG